MSRKNQFHSKEGLFFDSFAVVYFHHCWSYHQQQKKYLHQNPVKAGFVRAAEHWKYSSADNDSGGLGVINVLKLY